MWKWSGQLLQPFSSLFMWLGLYFKFSILCPGLLPCAANNNGQWIMDNIRNANNSPTSCILEWISDCAECMRPMGAPSRLSFPLPTGHARTGAMPVLRIWAAWFRNAVFGLRGFLCLWSVWDFKLTQESGISKMWWISHPPARSSFSLPRHGGLHYHLIPRRSWAWIAAWGLTVAMICNSASLS